MPIGASLETLAQDFRYAARALRRAPAFALTAILTAALGIGAATAVFSVVDRILFRSLPFPHEDRLVSVGMMAPLDTNEFLLPDAYFDFRRDQAAFESITSFTAGIAGCDLSEVNPVRLGCAQVEGNFLPTLGFAPFLGRNFTPLEDRPGAPPVALITYGLWQSRFGRDPNVVGRVLSIDGRPITIVGVLPPNFEHPTLASADLLLPQRLNEATEHSGRALRAFARLKPGISVEQARQALHPVFRRALDSIPPAFRKEVSLRIRSLRDRQIQDARVASWVLFGSVLAVLLVACANIANLLLARAVHRRKEFAVRVALGASRARLIQQTLTEAGLLGILGGAAGCFLAGGLLRLFTGIAPQGIPRLDQASLDPRVLAFAVAGSLLSGILFGLAPAFQSLTRSRLFLRESLVAVQIAASVVLLTGAGVLLRSLWKLESVPLGFDTGDIVTANFTLGKQRYADAARQLEFFNELEARMRRIPSLSAVAISDSLPPSGGMRGRPLAAIHAEGQLPFAESTGGIIAWRFVTPDYFAVLGIPLLKGPGFTERDRGPGEESVVLSESLARKLFPSGDALGRRINTGVWQTVVGIVPDVKNLGPAEPARPEYYVLRKYSLDGTFRNQAAPDGWRQATLAIRAGVNARTLSDWIKKEFAALDPELPVNISTMRQRVGRLSERSRFNAMLLALFAGIGVFLAAIGLYGLMAFLVGQRTREIGVRMALGATPRGIANLVLSRAVVWTLAGAAAGFVSSLFATRLLRTLLFQIPERDPWTFGMVLPGILAIALLAAWLPSRRAARVAPMTALRHE
jgi:putative ABC transport system permease protein